MIQIVLTIPIAGAGPLSTVQSVPFYGRCDVKILRVDIHSIVAFNWFTITSNTLLKPPYLSKLIFMNCNYNAIDTRYPVADYLGNTFIMDDILIDGKIDLKITSQNNGNFTSASANAVIWLDIEYSKNKSLLY